MSALLTFEILRIRPYLWNELYISDLLTFGNYKGFFWAFLGFFSTLLFYLKSRLFDFGLIYIS
jgi:hypothetical protein